VSNNDVKQSGEDKMTKEQECMKALQCLYLEVPSVIADDVKQKVIDALNEVKNRTIHSIINSCSSKIASAREGQLIERLKECGFEFKTKQELYDFAKERCEVEIHANKLKILKVDGKVIAEWWDTFEIKHEGNKVTAIAGKPPISTKQERR
jgi:predicted GNAT superfamily acetyltransferase